MEQIETVFLDYQSRTSVRLAQWLLKNHWKQDVKFLQAPDEFISRIGGTTAGVIIGDRALQALPAFPYIYDLSEAWKAATGLPFVFAAWIAAGDLPEDFIPAFNAANAEGFLHLDEIVAANPFPAYDLKRYYTENIVYQLDERMVAGMNRFLAEIA
jgi:chorismate dehydratase